MAKKRKPSSRSKKGGTDDFGFLKPHPVFAKMTTDELKALGDKAVPERLVDHWRMEMIRNFGGR